jgi:hypothetical protein
MLLPVLIAMVAGWLQRHQQQVITYLLDYKPEARKEKHAITQLTIYALALSRRTGLSVRAFKCAWFDERDYFEFFPLPAIYPRYGNDSPLCSAEHNRRLCAVQDYVKSRRRMSV